MIHLSSIAQLFWNEGYVTIIKQKIRYIALLLGYTIFILLSVPDNSRCDPFPLRKWPSLASPNNRNTSTRVHQETWIWPPGAIRCHMPHGVHTPSEIHFQFRLSPVGISSFLQWNSVFIGSKTLRTPDDHMVWISTPSRWWCTKTWGVLMWNIRL